MSGTTVSSIDQNNNSGTALERFKVKFSGLVLEAFRRQNIMRQFVWEKNARGSKSASFPAIGNSLVGMHITKGLDVFDSTNALLSDTAVNDILVKADRPMFSATAIDLEDDMMSDDVMLMHIANSLAEGLARDIDRKILQAAVLGARAVTNITNVSGYDNIAGGTQVFAGATVITTESVARAAIISAARKLDENDAPAERFAIVSPVVYHLLLQNSAILGAEYGGKIQGVEGKVLDIHGIKVFKSNNVPSSAILNTNTKFGNAASAGNQNVYYGTFTNTVGVVLAGRQALGGAVLRDVSSWVQMRDEERYAHKLKADFIGGFSYLRPECLIEISKAVS